MRLWTWIVGAVVLTAMGVTGILFIGHRMLETEQHLETVKTELERAKGETAQALVQIGEQEKDAAQLKSELDTSKRQGNEVQKKLDQTTIEVEQLKTQLATTQSELQAKQAGLEAAQSDLESAKQATDKAKAEAAEIEKSASNVKSELEKSNAERNELQTKLDQANSEIERLKSEFGQAPTREGKSARLDLTLPQEQPVAILQIQPPPGASESSAPPQPQPPAQAAQEGRELPPGFDYDVEPPPQAPIVEAPRAGQAPPLWWGKLDTPPPSPGAEMPAPVGSHGLAFESLRYGWSNEGGQTLLEIQGDVVNSSSSTVAVPQVVIALRDEKGNEISEWTTETDADELAPGEHAAFLRQIPSPPSNVRSVKVRFANL
jgi:predicted  nucleic acid-binding Zn-ribbon protein